MKLGIMSLYYSENLGEELYTETVKMICERELDNVSFEIIDIHARDRKHKNGFLLKVLKKLKLNDFEYHLRVKKEDKVLKKYYREKIHGCSGVIVPGGGYIKSSKKEKWDSYHRYNDYLSIMANACKKEGIKLFLNAVGHIKSDDEQREISVWKNVFSHPSISYLTCRDELSFFKQTYGEDAKQVCCSAAYSGDLFGVTADCNSNIIGIGIIRPDNFKLYGYNVPYDEYVNLIAGLVSSLEIKGYCVKLFTNGLTADYKIALEIQTKMNRTDLTIERPRSCRQLVEIISTFKATIVSRMHAAIAAYSLNIPTICLCWNNKNEEFMKAAGAGDLAIYPKDFEVSYIENRLMNAIKMNWPKKERKEYRETALLSLREICSILKKEI